MRPALNHSMPNTAPAAGLYATSSSTMFGSIAGSVTAFGVAVMQPTLPPLVRAWAPQRIGFATAVYTNGLLIGEILPAALTIPVVLPLIKSLGYDPVWFGILVIVLGEVGMVTPPVGLNVFVVARVTQQPVAEVFRGVLPHVVAHLFAVAILTIWPALVLWLPGTMK